MAARLLHLPRQDPGRIFRHRFAVCQRGQALVGRLAEPSSTRQNSPATGVVPNGIYFESGFGGLVNKAGQTHPLEEVAITLQPIDGRVALATAHGIDEIDCRVPADEREPIV
jgi:hypothetical protein